MAAALKSRLTSLPVKLMKDQCYRKKKYCLAVLVSHPIQYQAPLWRKLAQHPQIDLTVYFCSDYGVTEKVDPGFGVMFKWDIPLLEGYRYKFLKNCSPKPSLNGFWGLVNLGIVKQLYKNRYDALFVHSYAYATHLLAILAARLKGIKVLVRSESNLLVKRSLRRRLLKRLFLPLFFQLINSFMVIGRLNRQYYGYYYASRKKMYLAPYAVDNEWFFAQRDLHLPHRLDLKEELDISPNAKVILYAAKFLKRKRLMDLIQAFEGLGLPGVVLVIVGDGEERPVCERYVKTRKLRGVHFVGFKNQSELPQFYAVADVFCLPSEDEPWGLVLNEAMCFGLPIIATDQVGAAYDLINQGINGFIYQVGNIEALKGYLEVTLKDEELRQKMGKASLELIERWGYKENVEGLLEAMKEESVLVRRG